MYSKPPLSILNTFIIILTYMYLCNHKHEDKTLHQCNLLPLTSSYPSNVAKLLIITMVTFVGHIIMYNDVMELYDIHVHINI